jgi:hypothetical protein
MVGELASQDSNRQRQTAAHLGQFLNRAGFRPGREAPRQAGEQPGSRRGGQDLQRERPGVGHADKTVAAGH